MKTINYIVKRGPLAALFIMFIVFYACSDDDQPQNQKAEVTDFSPVTGGLKYVAHFERNQLWHRSQSCQGNNKRKRSSGENSHQ